MPADNKTYRSFTAFRMTTNRIDIILIEVKDLYDTFPDDAVLIPQRSVTILCFGKS